MKFSIAQALLLAGSAVALPTEIARRQALDDATILNFALTLEHLESAFYMLGLKMFPQAAYDKVMAVPRLRFNIEEVSKDEATHVSFLTTALSAAGATPVKACTYDFGLTDVESFLQTASILEGVGVTAYLGAASSISNPDYLTAAGAILTVEARHNAYLRDNQMAPGPQSPFPGPFDIPLSPNQVYTMASAFITGCPDDNPKLPFMAFPTLTLAPSNPTYLRFGYPVVLEAPMALTGTVYCAFPALAGPFYATAKISGKTATCTVPIGIPGQSYVLLTKSKSVADDQTIAGPALLTVQAGYTYPGFPM